MKTASIIALILATAALGATSVMGFTGHPVPSPARTGIIVLFIATAVLYTVVTKKTHD